MHNTDRCQTIKDWMKQTGVKTTELARASKLSTDQTRHTLEGDIVDQQIVTEHLKKLETGMSKMCQQVNGESLTTRIAAIRSYLEHTGKSQAWLASTARVPKGTVGALLTSKYGASDGAKDQLVQKLEQAIEHFKQTATGNRVPLVKTGLFKTVMTAAELARRHRNFSVVSAWVGTGKTRACREYADAHQNTALLEAWPHITPTSITERLCHMFGIHGHTTFQQRMNALLESLKDTDSLIIVDEAETVTPKVLETIRRIRDIANIGIVLTGTEKLHALISPQHGVFDQIRSRVGFWPQVIEAITKEDARALLVSALDEPDEAVITAALEYTSNSARVLCEGLIPNLRVYAKNKAITPELVHQVATQVLTLQRVA